MPAGSAQNHQPAVNADAGTELICAGCGLRLARGKANGPRNDVDVFRRLGLYGG